MSGRTVLVTRPKGDEKSIVEALHELDFFVIHEPLQEIFLRHYERQALERVLLDEPDAVIVTSRHGVQALALLTELRDLPLLCVGTATAQAAESQGFTRTSVGGGHAQSLIDLVAAAYDPGSRFLYVSGDHIRTDIAAELAQRGMQVQHRVVYEAIPSQQLSDTLVEQLRRGQVDGVTFLSQGAAQIFTHLLAQAGMAEAVCSLRAFCLSQEVAQPLAAELWQGIVIAAEPTLASLVASVDNAFRT